MNSKRKHRQSQQAVPGLTLWLPRDMLKVMLYLSTNTVRTLLLVDRHLSSSFLACFLFPKTVLT